MSKKKRRKPTYLSFKLGKENYAVSTTKVLEVLESQAITPVPNVKPHIKGLISFRGNILPVICMRNKLGLAPAPTNSNYVIIVFDVLNEHQQQAIAAIVDEVKEVVAANKEELLTVPTQSITFDPSYLAGMIKNNGQFTILFDVDNVF